MTDPATQRLYKVTLSPHELEAMREIVAYARAISQVLTDKSSDTFAVKLKNYASMIDDIIARIEAAEPESRREFFNRNLEASIARKQSEDK